MTRLEDSYEKKSPMLVYREKGLRWLMRTWQGLRPRDASPLAHSPRWVDASRRFIRLPNNELYGGVRITSRAAAPRSCAAGAEHEQLIAWIERELLALTDPDHPGRRLVRKVLRTEQMYAGDLRDGLPDLLIDWDHSLPINAAASDRIGIVRGEYDGVRSGDHRPTGMVLARAPGITGGRLPHDVQMVDLAPTMSTLAGVPMTDVDGVPIPGIAASAANAKPRPADPARATDPV